MPLAMQQVQKLQQTQKLIMTPQMQQSIKLLQLNTIEMENRIQEELMENPFLELEVEGNEDLRQEESEAPDMVKEQVQADDGDGPTEKESAADKNENESLTDKLDTLSVEEQPEQFSEVDTAWEEVFEDLENRNYAPPRGTLEEGEERNFEETTAGLTSLYEKLEWQLRVSVLEDEDLKIGQYLIASIDDDGYLAEPVEACAEALKTSSGKIEQVLAVIQEFDPPGVGARNLSECLCLQLEAQEDLTPLYEKLLKECWDLLVQKKFREAAKKCDASLEDVEKLWKKVQRLDPTPGRAYSKDQPRYIAPDVYVRKIDGQYMVYLNEGEVAHLRISNTYRDILLNREGSDSSDEAKEYATEKFKNAVLFIKNVERRRNTILRVTEAIMEVQQDFLEHGVEALRPLAMSEIAERVEMHESTISRVTTNKYVDTPQGLYELKYFFSSAIESDQGEAASSRSIKQKIQELVNGEPAKKPLSDDKIAKALKEQGFSIARRTVAKYREQLKILPANMRKQMKAEG